MKISNKKGIELSNAFGAVLAIVLVAVLVIIAIFIFDVLGEGFTLQSVTINNLNLSAFFQFLGNFVRVPAELEDKYSEAVNAKD